MGDAVPVGQHLQDRPGSLVGRAEFRPRGGQWGLGRGGGEGVQMRMPEGGGRSRYCRLSTTANQVGAASGLRTRVSSPWEAAPLQPAGKTA